MKIGMYIKTLLHPTVRVYTHKCDMNIVEKNMCMA